MRMGDGEDGGRLGRGDRIVMDRGDGQRQRWQNDDGQRRWCGPGNGVGMGKDGWMMARDRREDGGRLR